MSLANSPQIQQSLLSNEQVVRLADQTAQGTGIPQQALELMHSMGQKAIPAIAKNDILIAGINRYVRLLPTEHRLIHSSSSRMTLLPEKSAHLIVTSPPYWNLKEYPKNPEQLGHIASYEEFLAKLDKILKECFRVLVPGGRIVIVVGDVCLPRRTNGRHVVYPLHASIQELCRKIGFDNLAPIIWYKIANIQLEADNGGRFLGKPYEPNGIIKNDIEYILFERKPGGYRQPTLEDRVQSVIPEVNQREWFEQIWSLGGASTKIHPAPYPLKLAERLVRMFSFVGDTVLDPFMGTGTTNLAAAMWGRNSIGFEIEQSYIDIAQRRLKNISKQDSSI